MLLLSLWTKMPAIWLVITFNTRGKQLVTTGEFPFCALDLPALAGAYLRLKNDESANKSWLFHGNRTAKAAEGCPGCGA